MFILMPLSIVFFIIEIAIKGLKSILLSIVSSLENIVKIIQLFITIVYIGFIVLLFSSETALYMPLDLGTIMGFLFSIPGWVILMNIFHKVAFPVMTYFIGIIVCVLNIIIAFIQIPFLVFLESWR